LIEISENEKTYTYSIWNKRPIYNFSRIPRASRASLIPINVITFEEKTSLGKNQKLLKNEVFSNFSFPLLFFYEDEFHPN